MSTDAAEKGGEAAREGTRAELEAAGFHLIPLRAGSKIARVNGWNVPGKAWTFKPYDNVGIFTGAFREGGALLVLDVDVKEVKDGERSLEMLQDLHGTLPETREHATATRGRHLFFRVKEAVASTAGKLGEGLDVRSADGYVVAPGSVIDGKAYAVTCGGEIADAPQWLIDLCGAPRQRDANAAAPLPGVNPDRARQRATEYLRNEAPPAVQGDSGDATAYRVACKVKDCGADESACLELMLEHWNGRCAPPWNPDELAAKVANAYHYGTERPGADAPEAIFAAAPLPAVMAGAGGPARDRSEDDGDYTKGGTVSPTSDLANACRIEHRLRKRLRFVPGIGWHVWTGARWKADPLQARDITQRSLAQIIMREASRTAKRASHYDSDSDNAKQTRQRVEMLARHAGQMESVVRVESAMKSAEYPLRADPGALDANPALLGCENGVLDLHTGELRKADRDQLITKSTGLAYDPAATCPIWLAFLNRIFRGQPRDTIPFVQRLCGYWLTGHTDPAVLAVLWGSGANGKSTFVSAIAHALGDYAGAAPPSLLIVRYGDRHPTELAALQGRRLMVAAESGEDGRLDEERVKAITGGDTITARRMHQDFFQFKPTHKLALMTNHRPIVRGTDEGIWRRLLLIPFAETIPMRERDPTMGAKLAAEAPGILAWALQGCLAFQRQGLRAPAAVVNATREYRKDSDVLAQFIADDCAEGPAVTSTADELFRRYTAWAHENGERPMTKRTLGVRLQERGYVSAKGTRGVRVWQGVGLRPTG